MSGNQMRMGAIASIIASSTDRKPVDYRGQPARDIYGELVFSDKVIKERLPKDVYRSLKRTIDSGAKLDPSVADVVAEAMKTWALEKGAWPANYGSQPYPGTLGVTTLTDDTFPNTTSYYFWAGQHSPFGYTHISITGISEVDGTINATLWVPAEQ